jgi:Fur family ferric uptake transcriptional regulator
MPSLFQLAKEKDPKINRCDRVSHAEDAHRGGLVDELDLDAPWRRSALLRNRLKQEHAHVICLRCGRWKNFRRALQRLRKQIESHFDFRYCLRAPKWGGCAHCQTPRAREVEELRMLTLGAEKACGRARAPRAGRGAVRCHLNPGPL